MLEYSLGLRKLAPLPLTQVKARLDTGAAECPFPGSGDVCELGALGGTRQPPARFRFRVGNDPYRLIVPLSVVLTGSARRHRYSWLHCELRPLPSRRRFHADLNRPERRLAAALGRGDLLGAMALCRDPRRRELRRGSASGMVKRVEREWGEFWRGLDEDPEAWSRLVSAMKGGQTRVLPAASGRARADPHPPHRRPVRTRKESPRDEAIDLALGWLARHQNRDGPLGPRLVHGQLQGRLDVRRAGLSRR